MRDRRVLVTGSSKGIGRAVARRAARDGWRVAVHYRADQSAAEDTLSALGESAAGLYQADLADPSAAATLVARVLAEGPLHALVNNAGEYVKLDFAGSSAAETREAFERAWAVNFLSPALLVHAVCQAFVEQGEGRVVNVASRVGHRGEAGAAPYSASKAALINLTRALAVEHATFGVRHFAIAPGWVETSMAREGMETRLPEILRDIPLGRMATPEDCAGAVAFLLSEEADYLSGIVIDINGASYLR
ncbi:MAG: SDR family oxidoreductase [Fimbriimonadaceae bacterium]|nr:SDR family oxidoreductase [Fimbriimonadaceae bacterium]QYK58914.1 MAG: SDR family oxidoreductase [Fimbriimonadaceae bacterium]